MLKRATCKKLDLILDELKKKGHGSIETIFREISNYRDKEESEKKKLSQEYKKIRSKLICDKLVKSPNKERDIKDYLIVDDEGWIFKGYIKDRRKKIFIGIGIVLGVLASIAIIIQTVIIIFQNGKTH